MSSSSFRPGSRPNSSSRAALSALLGDENPFQILSDSGNKPLSRPASSRSGTGIPRTASKRLKETEEKTNQQLDNDGLDVPVQAASASSAAPAASSNKPKQDVAIDMKEEGPRHDESEMGFYKRLIDEERYQDLSDYLKKQKKYENLNEAQQKELFEYYKSKNIKSHYASATSAFMGYGGEGFYLYWDFLARVAALGMLAPGLSKTLNIIINLLATPFITLANVTYNPLGEANDYTRGKMLDPKKSITGLAREHAILLLAFLAYSFGGGYIEVEQLNDFFDKHLGSAKIVPISLLVLAAVCYYVPFQLNSTVEGMKKWREQESLLKKAFDCRNDETVEDRITALFSVAHETAAFLDRIVTMGYGGWAAGDQTCAPKCSEDETTGQQTCEEAKCDREIAGYTAGGVVALGTIPVGLATRCIPVRDMYFPVIEVNGKFIPALNRQEYEGFKFNWESQPKFQGWLGKLRRELSLAFSASVFLQAPIALASFQAGSDLFSDGVAKQIAGAVTAAASVVASHGIFRVPAIRKAVIEFYQEDKRAKSQTSEMSCGAKMLAYVSTILDQGSRTFATGYTLNRMFPNTFNTEDDDAKFYLFLVLCIKSFISKAALEYQRRKVEGAFESIASQCCTDRSSDEMKESLLPQQSASEAASAAPSATATAAGAAAEADNTLSVITTSATADEAPSATVTSRRPSR